MYATGLSQKPRQVATAMLAKQGGQHLVFVRYSPKHFDGNEYVYNRADIDRSRIVWARDMGQAENRELIDYYSNRKVWLWQPDTAPDDLSPIPVPGR